MVYGIMENLNVIFKAICSGLSLFLWWHGNIFPVSPYLSVHNILIKIISLQNYSFYTVPAIKWICPRLLFVMLISSRNTVSNFFTAPKFSTIYIHHVFNH